MSVHEDVVATVLLQVVLMPVTSSGPSIAAGCAILGLQVGRVVLLRNGLHISMQLGELHRTMESFLAVDGVRELQPRNEAVLTLFAGIRQHCVTYTWTKSRGSGWLEPR